jgi:hypothetical protein
VTGRDEATVPLVEQQLELAEPDTEIHN